MKNKILTILLSVAIAFGLWLYVITYEYTQIEYTFYNVEVQMLGESVLQDRGLMIASESEHTVDLTISGKRSDISKLKSSDITVLVDLTAIHEAGERTLSYDVSFPGDVQNSALEIVKRSPESIQLTIANWESKEIPVKPEILGAPADGFIVDEDGITVSHWTVNISGPKDLLDKIQIGKVAVDMEGAKETKEQSVKLTLCDKEGNPVDENLSKVVVATSNIQVKVPILKTKEIPLLLPVIPGGGLTADDVKLTISTEKITVSGPVTANLPDSITLGQIDLAKVKEGFTNKEYSFELPTGVNIEGNLGTTVFVSLKLPEIEERILSIPNGQIEIIGTPEGYDAEPGGSLQITFRGIKGAFDNLSISDISIVVDIDGATKTGQYPVQIKVPEGVKIGSIEEKTVYVLLTEQEE